MIRRVVSAALLVRDAFTGQPIVSGASLRCALDGQSVRPLWKPGGYLVLTDLAPGEHSLLLSCRSFRDQVHSFSTENGMWEREIDMEPAENYPNLRGAALLRLTLKGKHGPEAGASLWAAVSDPVSLRLAQAPDNETTELRLICRGPAERLSLPGWFLAADEGKEGPELLHLRYLRGETGIFDAPMTKKHPRGTELFRARQLVADADGRIDAAFRSGGKLVLFQDGKWKTFALETGTQTLEWKEG